MWTLLEACFIDEAFYGKNKTASLGTALLKHWVIRISDFLGVRLKEFCCICVFTPCNISSFLLLYVGCFFFSLYLCAVLLN